MKSSKVCRPSALAFLLLLLFGSFAGGALAKEKYEEKFEKTVALAAEGRVHLSNISGEIKVETWAQNQVKIDALKVSEAGSLDRAKENAALVVIDVREEGNVLRIETDYPEGRKFGHNANVSVNYHLWIPSQASVNLNSVSGGVDARSIGGSCEISVVSGDVDVVKAGKGVNCNTVSGETRFTDILGDVYLKTVSGGITVNGVRGSINAETVSGDIELKDVSEANTVRVKALSGEIHYEGKINPNGHYTLNVHSGTIEMVLPADSAFELEAETFSGGITSDFEIKVSGKMSRRELRGVVSGGGAYVKLNSFSGDIRLRKG